MLACISHQAGNDFLYLVPAMTNKDCGTIRKKNRGSREGKPYQILRSIPNIEMKLL